MNDSSSRVWLMTAEDQQERSGCQKKPVVIKGSTCGSANTIQPCETPSSPHSEGQASAYRRLRHWVRSVLRSRIMPSDVVVVRGVNQPLLKDQDLDGEETKWRRFSWKEKIRCPLIENYISLFSGLKEQVRRTKLKCSTKLLSFSQRVEKSSWSVDSSSSVSQVQLTSVLADGS